MSKKKLIKRCKQGDTVEKSDNTRVQMPNIESQPIYSEDLALIDKVLKNQPQSGAITPVHPEFELALGTYGILGDAIDLFKLGKLGINQLKLNKFKNIKLKELLSLGIIDQDEFQFLRTVPIKRLKDIFLSTSDRIILDPEYSYKDDLGFSLFHELGHLLGNRRGSDYLETFYSKNGKGYKYSWKESYDDERRNSELFADWFGFKVGTVDDSNPELLGRRNHFKSLERLSSNLWTYGYGNKMGTLLGQRVSGRLFGNKISTGGEQIIFEDATDPNYVLKIYNQGDGHSNLNSIRQFNHKYLSRNNVPFFVQSDFVGTVSDNKGMLYPVYRLRKMDNILSEVSDKTDWFSHYESLKNQLKPLGFNEHLMKDVREIHDVSPRNVALKNGKYWFIDIIPKGFKQGGRLVLKHNKGNKIAEIFGIDTSKFTKNPNSTRLDSKKVTNPNEWRNKLTKNKHASYINPLFVNARPIPGFTTVPRKKIIESKYKNS